MTQRSEDLVTLRGIITESEWDDDYNVTDISLATDSEEEYLIEREGRGRELKRYLLSTVEITGTMVEDHAGRQRIHVTHFRLLDS